MFKKIALLLVVLIPLLIFGVFIFKNQNTSPSKSSAAVLATADLRQNENLVQIGEMTFAWYQSNPQTLQLIPNFTDKLSSSEVIAKYNCHFLSNAGFYSKDNNPLGLFIESGNTLSDFQENPLFNGILSINDMATPRVTSDIPQDHLDIALQTGPIIKENNSYQTLKIIQDDEARRVMAGVTGENKLYFVVAYKTGSEYLGPKLADMPREMQSFEEKTGIKFADVINLDGGAASTFNTDSLHLSEFNPVGSFFCQP